MDETAQIKSSPQNWRARGLIISELTGQNKLNLIGGWSLTCSIESQKDFDFLYDLVKLFTVKNWLKLGLQFPRGNGETVLCGERSKTIFFRTPEKPIFGICT